MLNAKRADLTLMSFTAMPNMAHYLDDVTLLPIKGVKVAFKSSRHFIVSKKSPHAKKIIDALNDGIKALHKKNEITALYERGYFFHPATKDWKVVNK